AVAGVAAAVPIIVVMIVLAFFLRSKPASEIAPPDNRNGDPPAATVNANVNANVNGGDTGKAKTPPDAGKPQHAASAKLAQQAHDILKKNCYRCHGQDGENEGGLNYVIDLKTLRARNKVVAGQPEGSVLFQRITAKQRPMPPKGETPRPS